MDGIEQKVQLINKCGGGGEGGMNQECVDIVLRVMAAGSVREECSSPQMPTRHSRGKSAGCLALCSLSFCLLEEENG